jgi:sodium-independent sulfate anion transporter 11
MQVLLTFLTGCLITMMGLLYLGFLVDFISMPVICGFTNAAAIIIGSSQISALLGISGRNGSFIDSVKKLFENFKEIQLYDTLLGFGSIAILLGLKVWRFLFFKYYISL